MVRQDSGNGSGISSGRESLIASLALRTTVRATESHPSNPFGVFFITMKPDNSSVFAARSTDHSSVRALAAAQKTLIPASALLELLNAHLSVAEAQCRDEMALTITGIRGLGPTERKIFGRNWDVARFLWDGPGSPDDLLFALTHVVGNHYDVGWAHAAA